MSYGRSGVEEGSSGLAAEFTALDAAFDRSLAPYRGAGTSSTILFSGGVDSGLLAWELRSEPHLALATVGVAGAPDLRAAADAAPRIGLPLFPVVLGPAELERVHREVVDLLEPMPAGIRSIQLALAAAVAHAPPGRLLCGQGADELFLGYAHFRGLPAAEARARADADLRRLEEVEWPASRTIARRLGREIVAPYLDPAWVGCVRKLPIDDLLPGSEPKRLWRAWARHRGLPREIADVPKRALQFGSGIDRWLRAKVRE